jgi:hypothetical protein
MSLLEQALCPLPPPPVPVERRLNSLGGWTTTTRFEGRAVLITIVPERAEARPRGGFENPGSWNSAVPERILR